MVSLYSLLTLNPFIDLGSLPVVSYYCPLEAKKPDIPIGSRGPRNLPYPNTNLTQLLSLPRKQHMEQDRVAQVLVCFSVLPVTWDLVNMQIRISVGSGGPESLHLY